MKSHLLLLAGTLLSGGLCALSATPIILTIGGVPCGAAGQCTAVPGTKTITFNGLTSPSVSHYAFGPADYSWSAALSPFVNGSLSGEYAAPPADSTDYFTVGSGDGRPSTVTINFATPMNYFGLYMGSPDTYNSMTFHFTDGSIKTIVGGGLLYNIPADGNQKAGEYLNFFTTGGDQFDQIEFASSQAAFETDNHAFGSVPEPASMMLAGGALLGIGLMVRRKRAS